MTSNCQKCGKWTISDAMYCHHCGYNLAGQFNSSIVVSGDASAKRDGIRQVNRNKPGIWSEALIMTSLAVGVATIAPEYPRIALGLTIPLSAYTLPKLVPVFVNSFVDFLEGIKFGDVVNAMTGGDVIRVEHTERYLDSSRVAFFDFDFPEGVNMAHLAYIHHRLEENDSFTRRNLCKASRLSQGQFYAIRDAMKANNFLIPKHKDAPTMGLVLTPRGRKLLKRAGEMWENGEGG